MEIDRQCGIRTYKGKRVTILCEIKTVSFLMENIIFCLFQLL
jgi:hypothetical protein